MSKKTDLNNIDTKFDPKRVSKAGPENDLLLDYESERVVAGRGGLENTVGYNLPPKQNEIRYGKKVDPQRRVHRYHGPGVGLLVCVMLLLVVIACVGCGSALWAWDRYAYPYVNLSLPEAFSLASEMYEVDPDKVVTNPYDPEADLDSFYASFKEGMYLSADCDITIADIVNAVMPSEGEGEESRVGDDVNAENPDTGSDPLNALLERLEFDFDRLDTKTNEDLEKEVLEIGDKELAAVLNEAMQTAFEIDQLVEISQQYAIDFPNLIKVEQVVIDGVESVARQDDTRVLATVSVNIGDNIEGIARNAYDNILRPQIAESKPDLAGTLDGMSGTIISVLKKILPDMLYLTVAVYPNDTDRAAYVTYNNVEDEGKQELIDKLFQGQYLQMSDVDVNLNGVLDPEENGVSMSIPQIAGSIVANTIASLNETIMLNFTNTEDSNGVFQTKPIEFMLSILGADNISQGQFLAIMRDVQVPYDRMAEEYPDADDGDAYSNVTLAANLDKFIDGKDANDNIIETTLTNKYYFNNIKDEETGERVLTAKTLFSSIENLMSEEMIKQIEIKNENWKDSGDYYADEFKPVADYNALPGLINGYLGTQTEEGIAGMPAKVLKAAYLDNGTSDGAITLTIKADLLALVEESLGGEEEGESDPMADLVTQLLPKAIYLNVNYSLDGTSDVTITINDVDDEDKYGPGQSKKDFETIFKLLALFGVNLEMETESGVIVIDNYDEICEMVGATIASAFEEVGMRLGGGLEFTETAVFFPNIFQVISANKIFKYSEQGDLGGMDPDEFYDKYGISDEDLYYILRALYSYEAGDYKAIDDIGHITSELENKYYVELSAADASGLLEEISGIKNDFSKLNINGESVDGEYYMATDPRRAEELDPLFTPNDIAALINGSGELNMAEGLSFLTDTEITESVMTTTEDGNHQLTLTIEGTLDEEADSLPADAKMYMPLFPDGVYVTVTIGFDGEGNVATSYNLNGIETGRMTKMMFFIDRLSRYEDESDRLLEEALDDQINDGVNEAFDQLSSGGDVSLTFTAEGVELGNIFSLATATIWKNDEGEIDEGRPTDQAFQDTIQALWAGLDGYDDKYANGAGIKDLNYGVETAKFSVNLEGITSNSVTVTGSTMISDAFIGSQLASEENIGKIASALKVYSGGISLYQSYIIPESIGAEAESEYKDRYDAIVSYFGKDGMQLIDDGSANLLFTFMMTKDAFELEETDNIAAFIPDEMYLSAAISATENSEIGDIKVSINNLDDTQLGYVAYVLEKAGYASGGEGQSAGVFGGDYAELAEEIKEIKLVELKKEEIVEKIPGDYEIEGFDEGLIVRVKDLFSADGTMKFAYQITDDIAEEDQAENYIYQDYVGGQVALGYLAYSYEDTFTLTSSGGEGQG